MKKRQFTFALILFALLLTACTRQVGWVGFNYGDTFDATYQLFDGKKTEKFQIGAGDTLSLTYDLDVDDGALTIELVSPEGEAVWATSFLDDAEDMYEFTAQASGRYTLNIIGDDTEGGFDLNWEISD